MPETPPAAMDSAAHWNAELRDGGPRYTETPADPYAPGAPFIAEPWNMVTASFFVLIVVAWLVRLRGRYLSFPFLVCCLPVLFVGGVGGTLYHGLRTRQLYLALDVVPIMLLAMAGAMYLAVKLWRVAGWLYIGGAVVVNVLFAQFLFAVIAPTDRHTAINLNYVAMAAAVALPMLFVLIRTRFRDLGLVAASLIGFGIGWFFRLVDQRIGVYLPMGSHWLWHTFGAISVALLIEFFYRVERDGLEPVAASREAATG